MLKTMGEIMDPVLVVPVGVVLSALLGLNLWFLRALVLDVRRIPPMAEKMDGLEKQVQELSRDFKDINHLRERIAVLEALSGRDVARGHNA
jgi:uncharacterized membrane protein (DUF106 family)